MGLLVIKKIRQMSLIDSKNNKELKLEKVVETFFLRNLKTMEIEGIYEPIRL